MGGAQFLQNPICKIIFPIYNSPSTEDHNCGMNKTPENQNKNVLQKRDERNGKRIYYELTMVNGKDKPLWESYWFISEIKRETRLVEKIIELRISESGFWQCLCFINTTITKSILLPTATKHLIELMAIAALTQSFTALRFRNKSNESHG